MYETEQIKTYLSNLYENFILDSRKGMSKLYRSKCLGAMESLLVILGSLKAGAGYEYQTRIETFSIFGLTLFTYQIEESHTEHILRIVTETLNKKSSCQ